MESEFLEQWNAKFGAKPPEWVFTLTSQYSGPLPLLEQDVDRDIDKCEARIDELRTEIEQELFIAEWLRQQKASRSSALPKPPSSTRTQTSHVQFDSQTGLCNQVVDKPGEQSSDLKEQDEEASLDRCSPLAVTRGYSPGSQLHSHSEESFKSTPDSSEYHTAPQSGGEDLEDQRKETKVEELVSVSEALENRPSGSQDSAGRHRFAHKVNSTDVTLAKAVNKRLFEWGAHSSCNISNLKGESGFFAVDTLSPEVRKRSASDPPSPARRSKEIDLLSQPLEPTGKKIGQQEVASTVASPQQQGSHVQEGDIPAKDTLSPNTPESPAVSTIENLEKVDNRQEVEGNLKTDMTSEVGKRSSKEEDSIELRQWANLGPGKRNSNGIVENYEGYNRIVSPDEERDPALLNVLASRMRSSAHSSPRSSIELLRDPPPAIATTNGDGEHRNDTSGDLSPPHRPSHIMSHTQVADMSPGRGVPPALSSKPERGSLVFSEDECITPKGDSDHSMNLPEDESRTKDRSQTLVADTLSTENVSRVERLLEEVRRTQDQEVDDDQSMMTLTRKNIGRFRDYGGELNSQGLTPLGSLDIDIQETLSKIQSTPDMSMATLLDVAENREMNENLPATFADPSFDDFEYNENMDIDEATISALTLSKELISSRSNSVSSLPGLYSESTASISPPDTDSPLHRQGVNLRHTGGARRRDRKRMGNAELDIIAGASDEGSDLSPCHTVSSRSMSPTSELGSLASLTMSPSSPREFSGSDSSGGIADTMVSGDSMCVYR